MNFPAAVQAIAALEARTADFEGRMAAGTVSVADAEFVIRDCYAALDAIRREHGIELPTIAALHAQVFPEQSDPVTAAKAERARNERTWSDFWREHRGPQYEWTEGESRAAWGDR